MGGSSKDRGRITSVHRSTDGAKWDRLYDDEQSTSSQQRIIKSTHVCVETSTVNGDKSQDGHSEGTYQWGTEHV